MGIPKFNGQLIKDLKIKYSDGKKDQFPKSVSGLMIDFNDLLHFYSQKVYLYGAFRDPSPKQYKKMMDKSDSRLEKEFIDGLISRLEMYLEMFEPEDYFIVAVDGPVPLAKVSQQRIRRFANGPKPSSERFDNALLSPGTEIMENIHQRLQKWFYDKASSDSLPRFSVYSSFHHPGEGEHKMIQILVQNLDKIYHGKTPTGMHLVCGQDSDLTMLGSLIPLKNVAHYREDRDTEAKTGVPDYDLIMMDLFKKYVYKSFIKENCEYDFVLSYYIFGNDFMPKNPALNRADKTMRDLSTAYINTQGRLVDVRTGKINRANLIKFFSYFVDIEQENLDLMATTYNPKYQPEYPILTKNTKKLKNGRITLDISGFKKDWYDRAMTCYNEMAFLSCIDCNISRYTDVEVFKKDMFENYLEMLQWNIDYYLGKDVAWNFQYRYYFSPLISDLAALDLEGDILRRPDDGWKRASSCLRQLMMISYPTKVKDMLPKRYHNLLDTEDITKVSPLTPIVYPEGYPEKSTHLRTVILPLVTHDYFDHFISKYRSSLPERLLVKLDDPDVYLREEDIEYPEEEYIPGSKTRRMVAQKYEWVEEIVE